MGPITRRALVALAALLVPLGLATAPAPAAIAPPTPMAKAWILVDADTGEALVASRPHQRLPIASTTKLMTARLVLESLPLDRRVRAPRYRAAPAESKIDLVPGERMTVRDLLSALLLESANDAAVTLADAVAGSERRFVTQMNEAALQLGLRDTHYRNPVGLDAPGHVSSAADLARLTRGLLRSPLFSRIVDTPRKELLSGRRPRLVTNRNDLVLTVPWINGVKTGHTARAGYVLIGSGRRKGKELIAVVLGAPSEAARDAAVLSLLDYGFSRYRVARPVPAHRALTAVNVRFEGDDLPVLPATRPSVPVLDGHRLHRRISLPGRVEGPIRRGQKVGSLRIVDGRRTVATVPLVAGRAVAEPGALDRVAEPFGGPGGLAAISTIAIILGVLSRSRSRARKRARRAQMRQASRR